MSRRINITNAGTTRKPKIVLITLKRREQRINNAW